MRVLSGIKKNRKNSRFTGNFHAQLLLSGLNTGWYNSDYLCPCTHAGNTCRYQSGYFSPFYHLAALVQN